MTRLNRITIDIEPELFVKLCEAETVMRKSKQFFINECLRYYLKELADVVEGRRIRTECERELKMRTSSTGYRVPPTK